MTYEFKLPDIGEGVVEGEIVKWLVNEGDDVTEDQPLVEVMTDKATVTIPSPKKGKVLKRHGDEGAIVEVHSTLVSIEISDDGDERKAQPAEEPAKKAKEQAAAKPLSNGESKPAPQPRSTSDQPRRSRQEVLATPVTRRIAREMDVDLRDVDGSGPQGRVLKKDVLAYVERAPEAPTTSQALVEAPALQVSAEDERMPMRGLRKAIFRKMTQSEQFAVPFTYVDEVDMTELVELRSRVNSMIAKDGSKLTFLPFITKALVAALRKFPHLNAHMDEQTQELVLKRDFNVGIGVATDAGLTVAVVHDADRLSIRSIGEEIDRLATAARENKLSMQELSGSTFTITSLGKDGGMFATPVINHPEVAILGIHKIEARPVVVDRQIVVRDRMYMSCSFDHRVIDGHVGAAFVGEIKRLLEAPDLLFIDGV